MKIDAKLWLGLVILIVISPLGLIVPELFKTGSAWGEWGADEIPELVGYVPSGLAKLSTLWNAPIPDYAFQGWAERGLGHLSIAYIISAILGCAIIAGVMLLVGKTLPKKGV